jgi:hypothetical protein
MTTNLQVFEFEGEEIRNENGLWSVLDIIKILGQQNYPSKVWKRLSDNYPDVVTKCQYINFKDKTGRNNRKSPAADKQTCLEIIGLLPGQVGKKYREDSATVFIAYLEADIKLIDNLIQRTENTDDLEWAKERIEGRIVRLDFTAELKRRNVSNIGVGYNTNEIYRGLFDKSAKELKEELQCKNTRDNLSLEELTAVRFSEQQAKNLMNKNNSIGDFDTAKDSRTVATKVREIMEMCK